MRPTGVEQKGFGFIQLDEGGADVFVHIFCGRAAGLRELKDGQKITYELAADRKSGEMSADNLEADLNMREVSWNLKTVNSLS